MPHGKDDVRTPDEKMRDLLSRANDQRKTLLAIVRYCEQARPVFEVNEKIAEFKEFNHSVYSPGNLCKLLERAGGLLRVTADGALYDPETSNDARIVTIDGVEYLEPTEAPQLYWLSTEAALNVASEDDPRARMVAQIEKESDVKEFYRRILLASALEQGSSARDLASVVDMDPLAKAQDPVLTAPHFSNQLERNEAIVFTTAWHITALGKALLEEVFGISPDRIADEALEVMANAVPVPIPDPSTVDETIME